MIPSLLSLTPLETACLCVVLALIGLRRVAQFHLSQLNFRHVQSHAGRVPDAFRGVVDEATYAKSVAYTLANGRLSQLVNSFDALVLLVVLVTGVLPWVLAEFQASFGASAWALSFPTRSVRMIAKLTTM